MSVASQCCGFLVDILQTSENGCLGVGCFFVLCGRPTRMGRRYDGMLGAVRAQCSRTYMLHLLCL